MHTGHEADYILLSTVRTARPGFLALKNRTNVMLTRCRRGMVVVSNRAFLRGPGEHTLVGALAQHWEEQYGGRGGKGRVWADTMDVVNGRVVLPELQSLAGTSCKLLDLGQLKPGDPAFVQFSNTLRPILNQCANITSQIDQGIKTPTLNLPFGILSTDNQQRRGAVPGTVPGTPSPGLSGGPR